MEQNKRVGITLSGGGARGIAHIGVLQALEENGIYPEVISGTSAGSIVGALYASGKTPEEMIKFVKDSSIFGLITIGFPTTGLTKLTYLRQMLAKHIEEDRFEALNKKLFIAVANLNRGHIEIISSGKLFDVVMASSSLPLVFKPVEINGEYYIDGGILNNMPVKPLVDHSDYIIGVNVMPNVEVQKKAVQNVFGIISRCFDLFTSANTLPSAELCDLLIEPKALHDYNVFSFNKVDELFEAGYQAALEKVNEIKSSLREIG